MALSEVYAHAIAFNNTMCAIVVAANCDPVFASYVGDIQRVLSIRRVAAFFVPTLGKLGWKYRLSSRGGLHQVCKAHFVNSDFTQ